MSSTAFNMPVAFAKLRIMAGKATPAPPVGSVLGQKGVNIMDFCKQFNEQSKDYPQDLPLGVSLFVYKDKSFKFTIKGPSTVALIMKLAGIAKGSVKPGNSSFIGTIKASQLREIAKIKAGDFNTLNIDSVLNMLRGTARSIHIAVQED